MLQQLLHNFPLWTSALSIIFAQFFKVVWNYLLDKKWDLCWIFHSGSMPSAHTSAVTSLATSIGITQGWDSAAFSIATIVSIIVMYDATGVRRQAGMQAKALNQLAEDISIILKDLRDRNEKKRFNRGVKLKEILGHQPIEVFIGAWFGIFFSLFMYWIWYRF